MFVNADESDLSYYQRRYPLHRHNSLHNDEVQLKLQEEIRKAMERMEASQLELSNEKIKSSELQESLEVTKKELEEKFTHVRSSEIIFLRKL